MSLPSASEAQVRGNKQAITGKRIANAKYFRDGIRKACFSTSLLPPAMAHKAVRSRGKDSRKLCNIYIDGESAMGSQKLDPW